MQSHLDEMNRWLSRRDPEAFRSLVIAHAGMVYGVCRRILGDASDAEDVTQECFLALAVVDRAPRNQSVGAWLHGVATKRSLQRARNELRRRERETNAAAQRAQIVEPVWDDLAPHIDAAMAELPPQLHAPLVSYYLEGNTQREIAQTLGIPERTVSHRIAQAIDHLRTSLQKRGVVVSATALTSLCFANAATAAPPTLVANLGKLAIANATRTGVVASIAGGLGIGWKLAGAAAVIAVVGLTLIAFRPQPKTSVEAAQLPVIATTVQHTSIDDAPEQPATQPKPAEPTPAVPEPQPEPTTITGLVQSPDEQPVSNAEVILSFIVNAEQMDDIWNLSAPMAERTRYVKTTTDNTGRYTFEQTDKVDQAEIVAHTDSLFGRTHVKGKPGEVTEARTIFVNNAQSVHGFVFDTNGKPLDSALVSVVYAWRTKGNSYLMADRTIANASGQFTLRIDPVTEWLSLRVISPAIGQCYFVNQSVDDAPFTLRAPAPATLHGIVQSASTEDMRDLSVIMFGEVPEPELSIWHSGWRPSAKHESKLDPAGNYSIAGLYPGLRYRAFVYKPDPTNARVHISMLPKQVDFIFSPGETREWNPSIAAPVQFKGRVLTNRTKSPAPNMKIHVLKAGSTVNHWIGYESDQEGNFDIHLSTGPGHYQIVAYHGHWPDEGISEAHLREFAQSFDVKGGEIIESNLLIHEPAILPLQIVDDLGASVKSIEYTVHMVLPDGADFAWGNSTGLDDEGRFAYKIYTPAKEFWLEITPFQVDVDKPFATPHFEVHPGDVLPPQTIVFDRLCNVKARVMNADGVPLRHTSLMIIARFGEEDEQRLQPATDETGMINAESVLMPGTMDLRIEVRDLKEFETIEFGTVELLPGETLDLSDLIFIPKSEAAETP